MHGSIKLDGFDWKLLDALQQDASLTNGALAERIGLSASQVSRRRQRLEQDGVIRGYRALLEPGAVGPRRHRLHPCRAGYAFAGQCPSLPRSRPPHPGDP